MFSNPTNPSKPPSNNSFYRGVQPPILIDLYLNSLSLSLSLFFFWGDNFTFAHEFAGMIDNPLKKKLTLKHSICSNPCCSGHFSFVSNHTVPYLNYLSQINGLAFILHLS